MIKCKFHFNDNLKCFNLLWWRIWQGKAKPVKTACPILSVPSDKDEKESVQLADTFTGKTPLQPRRSSMQMDRDAVLKVGQGEPSQVNILRNPKEIPESDKCKNLTPRGWKRLMELQRKFEHDDSLGITYPIRKFITRDNLKLMVDGQKILNRPNIMHLDYNTINEESDASIKLYFADRMRMSYNYNADKYVDAFLSSTDKLVSTDPAWQVSPSGWHHQIYVQLEKLIEDALDAYNIILHGLSVPEYEDLNLPVKGYGTDKKPGWVRHFMSLLDRERGPKRVFSDFFTNKIGEEVLKVTPNVDKLAEYLRYQNLEMSRKSLANTKEQGTFNPPRTAKKALEEAENATKAGAPVHSNRPYDRRRNFKVLSTQLDYPQEQENPEEFHSDEESEPYYPVHEEHEDDEYNLGEEEFIERRLRQMSGQTPFRTNKPFNRPNDYKPNRHVPQRAAQYPSSARREDAPKRSPAERPDLPCFDYFEGKCTKGTSCAYSHEAAKMTKLAEQFLSKVLDSKHAGESFVYGHLRTQRNRPEQPQQQLRIMSRPAEKTRSFEAPLPVLLPTRPPRISSESDNEEDTLEPDEAGDYIARNASS